VLYLGRGPDYPLALEGALKLKEISYIHAEGYASGEMKHGPIALIDDSVPLIVLAPSGPLFDKTVSNMQEGQGARRPVVLISDAEGLAQAGDDALATIEMPSVHPLIAPLVYAVPVQLLAYHVAVAKGTDVDQPRNLAKSVTVESIRCVLIDEGARSIGIGHRPPPCRTRPRYRRCSMACEIVAGAELDRLHGGGDAGKAGQHDDQHRRIMSVQLRTQARPDAVPSLRSTTARLGVFRIEQRIQLRRTAGDADMVAPPLERTLERVRAKVVVLDDHEARAVHLIVPPLISTSGSSNRTSAPPPSRLSTSSRPPSRRATLRRGTGRARGLRPWSTNTAVPTFASCAGREAGPGIGTQSPASPLRSQRSSRQPSRGRFGGVVEQVPDRLPQRRRPRSPPLRATRDHRRAPPGHGQGATPRRWRRGRRAPVLSIASPRGWPAEWRMSDDDPLAALHFGLHLLDLAAPAPDPGDRLGMRRQSARITDSVPSGVPSSCAAPDREQAHADDPCSSAACWRRSGDMGVARAQISADAVMNRHEQHPTIAKLIQRPIAIQIGDVSGGKLGREHQRR
jgi:hypothetical protein